MRLGLALYVPILTLGRYDIGSVSLNTVVLSLTPQKRVQWEKSFNIECQERISDGGVFRNSSFYKKMVHDSLNLPPPRPLPKLNIEFWEPLENDDVVPFVSVANNAFSLTNGIMKPYPDKGLTDKKEIFGYCLSYYRRVTENAFGIMANVFRVFIQKSI